MSAGISLQELLAWNRSRPRSGRPILTPTRSARSALRHWRNHQRAGVCPPHLGRGAALGAAPGRPAGNRRRKIFPTGRWMRSLTCTARPCEIFREFAGRPGRKLGTALHSRFRLGAAGGAHHVRGARLLCHALFHSQRHWAQLATLVRTAGFPSRFGATCSSARRCVSVRTAGLGAGHRDHLPCFWKQERHSTGLPCVGLNGTVVSAPHSEQVVRVSGRTR